MPTVVLRTTTFYLVRHAHADWSDTDDRPLSLAGRQAALAVTERLASKPIVAVLTSPSKRAIDTIQPLTARLHLAPRIVGDLRERELPLVAASEFDELVREAWESPDRSPRGGESNARAQARALAVMRAAVADFPSAHVVLATHGNLLALILNGLDSTYGYEFWRRLSFPDIYRVSFDGPSLASIERIPLEASGESTP